MTPLAAIVDWDALLEVVVASFVAGIGAPSAFAIAILGAARFADFRSDGRSVAAGLFAALTVAALAFCAAAVVFGIVLVASK
jgi:hypothetical protein